MNRPLQVDVIVNAWIIQWPEILGKIGRVQVQVRKVYFTGITLDEPDVLLLLLFLTLGAIH
jgi:hypothetical protein